MKLPKQGNSNILRVTREMKRYLGVADTETVTVDLEYENGAIVLRRPKGRSFQEAADATFVQFDNALKNLSK